MTDRTASTSDARKRRAERVTYTLQPDTSQIAKAFKRAGARLPRSLATPDREPDITADDVTERAAEVVGRHGYVLPGGICACGHDLQATHGGYTKAWRAHLAHEIGAALHRVAMPPDGLAWEEIDVRHYGDDGPCSHVMRRLVGPWEPIERGE